MIEHPPTGTTLKHLSPANHPKLLSEQSGEPFPIISRLNWHAHRLSPTYDNPALPTHRRQIAIPIQSISCCYPAKLTY